MRKVSAFVLNKCVDYLSLATCGVVYFLYKQLHVISYQKLVIMSAVILFLFMIHYFTHNKISQFQFVCFAFLYSVNLIAMLFKKGSCGKAHF